MKGLGLVRQFLHCAVTFTFTSEFATSFLFQRAKKVIATNMSHCLPIVRHAPFYYPRSDDSSDSSPYVTRHSVKEGFSGFTTIHGIPAIHKAKGKKIHSLGALKPADKILCVTIDKIVPKITKFLHDKRFLKAKNSTIFYKKIYQACHFCINLIIGQNAC